VVSRVALVLALGTLSLCRPLQAQERPRVDVTLDSAEADPRAVVILRDLLSDRRFLRAMQSGFPLYIEYVVELRRSRSNWFDRGVDEAFVEYVVSFDPVREVYLVEDAGASEILPNDAALRRRLESVYIFPLHTDEHGTFYYSATVSARTLSDEDVDEVFDWLRGDSESEAQKRGLFTRTARKLLVQVAPLPRLSMTEKSTPFRRP
jgi:hypothetical protein